MTNPRLIANNKPFLSTKMDGNIEVIEYIYPVLRNQSQIVLRNIDNYLFLKRKRIEIENNAKDFLNYFKKINKNVIKRKYIQSYDIDPIFIDFNRLFINFSTSVRVLTSTIEKLIETSYNKSDIELNEFEQLRKNFYDSFFSYRFLYHIRNFSLHFQYPIHYVHIEFTDYQVDKPKRSEVKVMFCKEHLLSDKYFASKMAKDLEKYGDEFPVVPIIEEVMNWLKDYFKKFILIERNKYLETFEVLESLCNIYDYKNIGISLKEYDSKNIFKISTLEIPTKLLLEIKKNLK
jgi:hypothetical protein